LGTTKLGVWQVPSVFEFVALARSIDRCERFRAFTGYGLVSIVDPRQLDAMPRIVDDAVTIGQVVQSESDDRVALVGVGAES
jgi:phosphoribosylaminoimidazole (AIR) synthetase